MASTTTSSSSSSSSSSSFASGYLDSVVSSQSLPSSLFCGSGSVSPYDVTPNRFGDDEEPQQIPPSHAYLTKLLKEYVSQHTNHAHEKVRIEMLQETKPMEIKLLVSARQDITPYDLWIQFCKMRNKCAYRKSDADPMCSHVPSHGGIYCETHTMNHAADQQKTKRSRNRY